MALPEVHRDVEGIADTYCMFCGWPVMLAEDPDRQDFCDHVLFMALGESGIVYVGESARKALIGAGFSVSAYAQEWEVLGPDVDAAGDSDDDESPSVSDLVASMSSALEPPEGLLLVDDPAFLGDTTLYLGLGRWSAGEPD